MLEQQIWNMSIFQPWSLIQESSMKVKMEYLSVVWDVKELLVYTAVLFPSRLVATIASFKETKRNILNVCWYLRLISWFRDF